MRDEVIMPLDRHSYQRAGIPILDRQCVLCGVMTGWHSRRERERHMATCAAIRLATLTPTQSPQGGTVTTMTIGLAEDCFARARELLGRISASARGENDDDVRSCSIAAAILIDKGLLLLQQNP